MKPIHTHDAIRAHLQIRPNEFNNKPSLETLKQTQWSPKFEQYMRNRLIMGALRYETFDEKRANNKYHIIESIRKRLALYEKDPNQEYLVDSANLLMIEFECPTIPNPYGAPTDDGEHVQCS